MEEISLDQGIIKELGYDIQTTESGYAIDTKITKNGKVITEIEIPSSFTAYGETYKITKIAPRTFEGCRLLESIIIPDTVKIIGNEAFKHCLSLKNITIPDGVEIIGSYVFEACKSLKTITIPKSVKAWIVWAGNFDGLNFYGCKSLENVTFLTNKIAFLNQNNDYKRIPGVLARGAFSFRNFGDDSTPDESLLKSINIPNGIEIIQWQAFRNCPSLEKVIIPESVRIIGTHAFENKGSLKMLEIPSSVTEIANNAFDNVDMVYYNGPATGRPWGAKEVVNNKFYYNKKLAELRQQNQ